MFIKNKIIFIIFYVFLTFNLFAKNYVIEIIGNDNTDTDVVYSLLEKKPQTLDTDYSNYLLKKLNQSGLFKNVRVEMNTDKYIVYVDEYPNINNVYYNNNKRLKDEDLDQIYTELNIFNLNPNEIHKFIKQIEEIYKSFGYNQIKIKFTSTVYEESNTADLYLDIIEGKITKIKNIYFVGNNNFESYILRSEIKSKTKNLLNIFANNNFKLFQIQSDSLRIENFYKNNGFIDVKVNFDAEYESKKNKALIYFRILEGVKYNIRKIDYENLIENLDDKASLEIENLLISKSNLINKPFNQSILEDLKSLIADILENNGYSFFEIKTLKKIENEFVDIGFQILSTEPKYLNQINIAGNYRTLETVIRREISISEGDPISDQNIKEINNDLRKLGLFGSIKIEESFLKENEINLDIEVEEKQTGTFQIGLSIDSLDGITFITGLKEKNFGGTGRSVNFLINTSDDNKEFLVSTTSPYFLNTNIDYSYGFKYGEKDYSNSQSYKLNEYGINTGLKYEYLKDLIHNINLTYKLKDYIVTDKSTASDLILSSQGKSSNVSLENIFTYNTLNSFIRPTNGNYINFMNVVQAPTSSNNGYLKNLVTYKKFIKKNKSIFSFQSRLGNILPLQNNEILTDEKFSLGGKWLRGFDLYGAGPRNSVTSYVGGKNLIVTKLDYSKPINKNSDAPIYLNFFNDYGLLWGNKITPTNSDNNLRASYGFGIKYYSAIGPISFTWGFPLMDESYDIKRMFMFQIGYID